MSNCEVPTFFIFLAYSIFEAWLGSTKKVKQNSAVALIAYIIVISIKTVFTRKQNKEKENV